MKEYEIEITASGSSIVTVWADNEDDAINLAIEYHAEGMVEYYGEVLSVVDEDIEEGE